jgi:hypothetical protein
MLTEEIFREEPGLSQFASDRLLAWLDENTGSRGERYLEMRRRLVSYFDRRNRPAADELADETLNPAPDRRRAAPPSGIVTLVLLAPTRGIASVPTLDIPGVTDRVAFDLRIESDDFPRYRVGLENPVTNHILWRSDWIRPRSSADQPSVSVVVPRTCWSHSTMCSISPSAARAAARK